jgi:hypothetical protein
MLRPLYPYISPCYTLNWKLDGVHSWAEHYEEQKIASSRRESNHENYRIQQAYVKQETHAH